MNLKPSTTALFLLLFCIHFSNGQETPTRSLKTASIAQWISTIAGPGELIATYNNYVLVCNRSADGQCTILTCLDAKQGIKRWESEIPRLDENYLDNRGSSLRSKPAFFPGHVAVFCNNGEIRCYDLEGMTNGDDGEKDSPDNSIAQADLVWSLDLRKKLGVFKRDDIDIGNVLPSVVVSDQKLYSATGHGSSLGIERVLGDTTSLSRPETPSHICISALDGKLIWTSTVGSRFVVHSSVSSPVPINISEAQAIRTFVLGGDGSAYLVDGDGKRLAVLPSEKNWNWSWTTPKRCGDFILVCAAIPPGLPLSNKNRQCILGYSVERLSIGEIEPAWVSHPPGYTGSLVDIVASGNLAYIISTSGELFAINIKSGETKWKHVFNEIPSKLAKILITKNRVFIAAESYLYCFEASPKKKLLGKIKLDVNVLDMSITDTSFIVSSEASVIAVPINMVLGQWTGN